MRDGACHHDYCCSIVFSSFLPIIPSLRATGPHSSDARRASRQRSPKSPNSKPPGGALPHEGGLLTLHVSTPQGSHSTRLLYGVCASRHYYFPPSSALSLLFCQKLHANTPNHGGSHSPPTLKCNKCLTAAHSPSIHPPSAVRRR
jgi:hypothetical protein